jgi:hypothetical protein
MKNKIEPDSVEDLITNILLDIELSLKKKISDYRLDLVTLIKKEAIFDYIENEKTNIRKSFKETTYKHRTAIDKYLEYLSQDSLDTTLRRNAIMDYIYTSIIKYGGEKTTKFFFNSNNYKEQRKLEIVKNLVQRATLLEYNSFLTDEINQIKKSKQEKIKIENSISGKLIWAGGPTNLTELIKALIENGNLKIEKGGIIDNELNQKIIFDSFTNYLNFEIKNPNNRIQQIKVRFNRTRFIDSLRKRLDIYFKAPLENDKQKEISQKKIKIENSNSNKLIWTGNQSELTELIKALIENRNLKIEEEGVLSNDKNQDLIFDSITNFLNFKIQSPNTIIEEIRTSKDQSITKFLDILILKLNNHFDEKNK